MGELSESRVFVFGASAVGAWVGRFATQMGFPVTVFDNDESKFAAPGFEDCDFKRLDFENMPSYEDLGISTKDMCCVITRGHSFDPQCFVYAMKSPAFYVGMMGKPSKNAKCAAYALEHGCSQEQVDRCVFPIGVAIGAIDAKEIGLSVVAQLVQKHNERFPRQKDHESLHAE